MSSVPDRARQDAVDQACVRWRRELAALGGRNTLLWHKDLPLGTLDLTVAHPGGVAKVLTGRETLLTELVREQVAFGEAHARVSAIRARTAQLWRRHGIHVGFIAIGLATWVLDRPGGAPRAPVLLRACRVTPTDATHRDFVITLDPQVVFNPVLEQYLSSELGLQLDGAHLASLADQGSGFDPRPAYTALERVCRAVDGFGIGPNLVIGTFPWAKLPLVADLADPASGATSTRHDVVAALAGAEVTPAALEPDATSADDPGAERCVLDADHAQRLVVDEVRRGGQLVLDAPAGTGSTQTVANIVATAMSMGRRVLVVSEETPARQALVRRLAHADLDDLVLSVGEDRPSARSAIIALADRLRVVLEAPEDEPGDDPRPLLEQAHTVLTRHEEVMHARHEPWGTTLAQTQAALATLAVSDRPPVSRVRLRDAVLAELTDERRAEVTDALVRAATIGAWGRGRGEDPWFGAALTTEEDVQRAGRIVDELAGGLFTQVRAQADQVCRAAGLPVPTTIAQWERNLELIAGADETLDVFRPEVYDAPLDELASAMARRGEDPARPGAVPRARLRRQARSLLRPGPPPTDLADRVRQARDERREWEQVAGPAARPSTPDGWEQALEALGPVAADLRWLDEVLQETRSGQERPLGAIHLDRVLERLLVLDAHDERRTVTAKAHALLDPLRRSGLDPLIEDLARRGVPAEQVPAEVDLVYRASVLDHLVGDEQQGNLAHPTAEQVSRAERSFRRADRAHLRRNAAELRRTVAARAREAAHGHPEQATTLQEVAAAAANGRQTPGLADLLSTTLDVASRLAPCVIASPLALAASVPAELTADLVVVDHAASTRTARVVGALRRAPQAVVVGDSSAAAARAFSVTVDPKAEADAAEQDLGTSFLSEAAQVLPTRTLDTHYRSLSQDLQDRAPVELTTFPGVLHRRRVEHRVGEDPADWVVQAVLEHARHHAKRSLAVLVDAPAQLEQLDVALRAAITAVPVLHRSFREDAAEGFLLATVDAVAGEARDRVLWWTDPTADVEAGVDLVTQAFGAARRELVVITPSAAATWPGSAAARSLRRRLSPSTRTDETASEHPLLRDLAVRLEAEGLTVHTDVGHGPQAVRLAVEHPTRRDRDLLALDTDLTPQPDRLAATRDVVRLRHEQLTRLGWAPVRVRGTDLFRDPAREVARVLQSLRDADA